ncbi:MAG: hypothetical protein HRU33_23900 [Rhodobacteraceae bacterium]|nr:hypothetical protein [Paracoccaceae bacterium]
MNYLSNPTKDHNVTVHDTFELKATISKVERYRSVLIFMYLAVVVLLNLAWPSSGTGEIQIVANLLVVIGAAVHREVVESRLDVLRSSFRDILTKRDPSILNNVDY